MIRLPDSPQSLKAVMTGTRYSKAVHDLHNLCAVYTRPPTAKRMLDGIGWTARAHLFRYTLLEPCAGEGALITLAADRLIASICREGHRPTAALLKGRIIAYELDPAAAKKARASVCRLLIAKGLSTRDAWGVAKTWVQASDFLLCPKRPNCTHIVANPPYVRWSRVPFDLARRYRQVYGRERSKGDLSILFLHAILDHLSNGTQAAVLCTDRWLYSHAGESLRTRLRHGYSVSSIGLDKNGQAFEKNVLAYPIILKLRRGSGRSKSLAVLGTGIDLRHRSAAVERLRALQQRFGLIQDAGCSIKVGPALGCETAFVFPTQSMVEPQLLRPYLKPDELSGGGLMWTGRFVAKMNASQGEWIKLDDFPKMHKHLKEYKDVLTRRACVLNGGPWHRTIDRIDDDWALKPKLLIPEHSSKPCAYLDQRGYVPSHGIYAIVSRDWPLAALHAILSHGLLYLLSRAIAPIRQGSSFRLYKRFLAQLPLPCWLTLSDSLRVELTDPALACEAANELLGFKPPSS
jgi:hypothetical protein